nr:uncharacterized protein LOC124213529 isoform X1 [Neodiprion pinetum]XP_046470848.1 uncharacterized protein LOC124213529 isoform X1 [Neodiprion pinetum]
MKPNNANGEVPNVVDDEYEARGGQGSLIGFLYQLKVLMLFMIRGLRKDLKFRLATEMMAAGNFDDLVLEFKCDDDTNSKKAYRFLQAKHRQHDSPLTSALDLFRNDVFDLRKYFDSYRQIKRHPVFSQGDLKDFIIYTTVDLDAKKLESQGIKLIQDEPNDDFLDFKNPNNGNRRYKFDSKGPSMIYEKLASEAYYLAQTLAAKVLNGEKLTVDNEILKKYRHILTKEVINVEKKKFSDAFIKGEPLSDGAKNFREKFFRQYLQQTEHPENDVNQEEIWNDIKEKSLKFSDSFVSDCVLENLKKLPAEFQKLLDSADDNKLVIIETSPEKVSGKDKGKAYAPNIVTNIDTLLRYVLIEETTDKIRFKSEFLNDMSDDELPGDIPKLRTALRNKMGKKKFADLSKYHFEIGNLRKFHDSDVSVEEIRCFLEKLTVAVKQPDENELDEILKIELAQDCMLDVLCADSVTMSFQREMEKWFLYEKGSYKSGDDVREFLDKTVNEIITLKLSGLNSEYPEQLENYGMYFEEANKELVKYLNNLTKDTGKKNAACNLVATEGTLIAAIQVHREIKNSPEFHGEHKSVIIRLNELLLPSIRKHVIDVFRMKDRYHLLVVVSEGCNDQELRDLGILYKDLNEIMTDKGYEMKRLIFVTSTELRFENCYQIHCDLGFNDLTDESQRKLLNKQLVNLQDRKENMSFTKLLRIQQSENVDPNGFKNFRDAIDSTTLEKLIRGRNNIKIGSAPQGLGSIKNYFMNRTFHRRVIIKADVFESELTSEIYAVGHVDLNFSQNQRAHGKMRSSQRIHSLKQQRRFVELNSGEEETRFEELCNANPSQNVHWLMWGEGGLLWIRSNGSIDTLLKYRDLGRNFDCNYRCAVCKSAASNIIVDELNAQNVGPVIVSDVAGMGKTTILTHFTTKMEENNPKMWVIRINLNDYTEALAREKSECNVKAGDEESVTKFLVNDFLELKTEMERVILKYLIKVPGSVALLFDGFDEISPRYTETVIKMLKALKEYSGVKLVVTTRPQMPSALESTLQTFSYAMEPFSREDQIDFLVRYWRNVCNQVDETLQTLKTRAGIVLEEIGNAVSDRLNEFAGIALQTQLIGEIFAHENVNTVSVVNRDGFESDGRDCIKLADLYRMFFDRMFEIHCEEKLKVDPTILAVRGYAKKLRAEFLENHRRLAMYTFLQEKKSETWTLSAEEIVKVNKSIAEIRRGDERMGIVTSTINQRVRFIHRTFLEYFVASYLFHSLKKSDANESTERLKEFILIKILQKTECKVIRAFLNDLLSEPPVNSIFDAPISTEEWEVYVSSRYYGPISKIAAREGNYEIMEFVFSWLAKNSSDPQKFINAKFTFFDLTLINQVIKNMPLHRCQSTLAKAERAALTWLLEHKADVNVTDSAGNTSMHLAVMRGNLMVLKLLADQGGADMTARNDKGETLQHIAAKFQKLDMLKWLLEDQGCDVNVQDDSGMTLQHVAAGYYNLDVLNWLVRDQNCEVNVRDDSGIMWQRIFAEFKVSKMPKQVVDDRGRDVNVQDHSEMTLQHVAIGYDDLDELNWLVKDQNCEVNVRDDSGMTWQRTFAKFKVSKMPKQVVEDRGCDVNVRNDSGITLQHVAAACNNLDVLKWLVEDRGCDVNVRYDSGMTLQHVAAACNNLDMLKWLVEDRGCDVNVRNDSGITLQYLAAKRNNLDMLKWLVEDRGCDVNVRNDSGITLQHVAAAWNNLDMLKWLVEDRGCDVNVRNDSGITLQYLAAECNNLDMLKWLVEDRGCDVNVRNDSGMTLQYLAAKCNNLDMLKWLVEDRGCDVNVRNDSGITLQHVAAAWNNLDVLKWLVEDRGCDVNVRNDSGITLQYLATECNNLDMLKWLVEDRGCDVNVRNDPGITLQHVAAARNNLDVLKWLVEDRGCDVNVRNDSGITLQYLAAECNNLDMLKWLVEDRGCDVNVRNDSGITLQHVAAARNNLDVLKWLVEDRGCDVNVRDDSGMTLQHVAAGCNNLDMLKWLVEDRGCDVNVRNDSGITLQYLAAECNNLDMLKWLVEDRGCDVNVRNDSGITLQHVAAACNNLDVLKWLVEDRGCDVNVRDDSGMTLQHVAAECNNLDMLKWLVEDRGCDVNVRDDSGMTLQHVAAECNNLDMLKWLVEDRGCDVNVRNDSGITLQHVAAARNNLDVLKWLVEDRGCDVNVRNDSGITLQYLAAECNNLDMLKWLVEDRGCDVNVRNDSGITLQHVAAARNNLDVLKWLVEDRGCDVNVRDDSGMTLQHVAAGCNNLDMLKWLVEDRGCDVNVRSNMGSTLQHIAAKCNKLDVLKWLVEDRGCDVNVRNESGITLQYLAAECNNLDMLKWLVEDRGCDVNVRNDSGITLQHVAAACNNLDVLKWLVEDRGCDVNVWSNMGSTLQHIAAECNKLDVLKWLVEDRGCDVNVRDNSGMTLQHIAGEYNNLDMLKWLVEDRGCDVNVRDDSGMTLQHVAAGCNNLDMLKWLVEDRGCDVNVRDDSGMTLQHVAAECNNLDMLKWLVEDRGCDVNVRDNLGMTLQHIAAECGSSDVLKWLVEDRCCDVNVRDDSGMTLQHVAALYNYLDILASTRI